VRIGEGSKAFSTRSRTSVVWSCSTLHTHAWAVTYTMAMDIEDDASPAARGQHSKKTTKRVSAAVLCFAMCHAIMCCAVLCCAMLCCGIM